MLGLTIAKAQVRHERVPIDHPVKTSFGVMRERHAVLVILQDESGCQGIGESWVNFPLWAPWERKAAFEQAFIPHLQDRVVEDISAFITRLYLAFLGPAQQSGTTPALVQAICAIELALWDLESKRAGKPLAQHLFPNPLHRVRVYASGINAPLPWDLIESHLDRGVTLFKLKLGFGDNEDRRNLDALAQRLQSRAAFAVDVNRGWTLDKALAWLPILKEYQVQWIEEPLAPDAECHLPQLQSATEIPIAGGENILMPPGIDSCEFVKTGFDILQPDLTKYTPLHIARELLVAAKATGKRIVPHILGSAPGQAASLHFASGCPDGLVELDINRNPLRTDLFTEPFEIIDGAIKIPEVPGLGWRLRS